ncbi:thiamine pyrophosphate-binding protein [Butyrivibrio proteoclasticus]|uniref:thiamine pyrophosphate-binding protein n=1 Tax=Butyrivibrio proteoclasticus TaxID=43305 RepID=UPI00047BC55B|nr:thiamine pyrophosphate-binding protein [Butyrivibrio proteoclasticus]
MKVSDYIVDFLRKKGVTDCFMVVGGGAMFLDNSFGHAEGIKCTHFHHEQGAAIAAESYSRLNNQVAALCVTSGPGGTNAITGVLGGWLDSLPMFVVSGQVRYDTTVRYWKQNVQNTLEHAEYEDLRSLGDQEYDITKMTGNICKYAVMLEKPEDIRYHLEKAWFLMTTGRPGPVWLDVPVNYQNTDIDVEKLRGFDPDEEGYGKTLPPEFDSEKAREIIEQIRLAKRPVIYAGAGVRLSGGFVAFRSMVRRLGVPVCTYWDSIDLMEDDNPLYCGRGGNMGDRPGNFAIQNSDLLLVIGSRLSIRQVGYNWSSWAREARVIMVDIDRAEMTKHTIHVDERIWADARDFCEAMAREAGDMTPVSPRDEWREQCIRWKEKYPVVSDQQKNTGDDPVNVYGFMRSLSERLPKGSLTAVSNGACCVAGHQSYVIKEGSRFFNNNGVASMGYGLPAAIGMCISAGRRDTICLEGDGSIMMNLQELQTVITNKLPIKIFLINNNGYHSIRLTQNNIFSEYSKVGIGPESGDLAFPSFEKIASAFGYKYISIRTGNELADKLGEALNTDGALLCEVFTDTTQVWEPKSSARRNPDGTLSSPPLEDLAPFLPRQELKENMYIALECE